MLFCLKRVSTVSELARRCGVARNTMSKVVNERGDVTEDIAIRLSRVLGSTPRFLDWYANQSKSLAVRKHK